MNEKIRELAKLSRLDVGQIMCEIFCYDYTSIDEKNLNDAWVAIPIETRGEITDYIEQMQERFAELIIGECINICISNRNDDSAQYIEKHFGVEE